MQHTAFLLGCGCTKSLLVWLKKYCVSLSTSKWLEALYVLDILSGGEFFKVCMVKYVCVYSVFLFLPEVYMELEGGQIIVI